MLIRTTIITGAVVTALLTLLIVLLPVPRDAADTATTAAPFVSAAASADAPAGDAGTIVIDNVRWFDGERLHDAPASLVLRDGRVQAIRGQAPPPSPDAQHLDGTGLTALPGLIDAHVHVFGSARRDALRFGVTTVFDMFTAPTNLRGTREDRESYGTSEQAALWSAGMLATVEQGHGTQYGVPVDTLQNPAEAEAWVEERLAEGSDYIKLVYMPRAERIPSLDLATARAVIDAAHGRGVMAVAHISSLAGARDMLAAGIDGLVHVFADELVDDAFLAEARERGLFVVPTLAVIAMVDGKSTGPALIDDPDIGPRLDDAQRGNLRQDFGGRVAAFDLDTALANVRRLHEAGVPILAGSDAPNPGTAHGATLHAELALLVRAGLTPAEALAAATSVPARIFGAEGRGVIRPGGRADLLLVQGDPTQDIRATRALKAIFRNGRRVATPESGAGPTTAGDAAKPAPAGLTLPDRLGDFDGGLAAPPGLVWTETSDAMMGGTSTAELTLVARGEGSALQAQANVEASFAYPWAGIYLGASSADSYGDIGDVRAVAFDVRGTPATYRLMMFADGSYGAPPTATFQVSEQWQHIEIPLERFAAFTPSRFSGMAFVTPMEKGRYRFAIDEVRLIR